MCKVDGVRVWAVKIWGGGSNKPQTLSALCSLLQ